MSKEVTVNVDEFTEAFDGLLDALKQDVLQEKIGQKAIECCKKYRPVIKADAQGKIKKPTSHKPYVSSFTVVPLRDMNGTYGAALWNRNYQLSHLIEDPHDLWTGGMTSNNYGFWKDTEDPIEEAFLKAADEVIDEALKS